MAKGPTNATAARLIYADDEVDAEAQSRFGNSGSYSENAFANLQAELIYDQQEIDAVNAAQNASNNYNAFNQSSNTQEQSQVPADGNLQNSNGQIVGADGEPYVPDHQAGTLDNAFTLSANDLRTNLSKINVAPVSNKARGVANVLSLASMMNKGAGTEAAGYGHQGYMQAAGQQALNTQAAIYKAYTAVGLDVPVEVQNKITQLQALEAQYDKVANMHSAGFGIARSNDLNPIGITKKINDLKMDLLQMTAPVTNYETRLNMVMKKNEADIKSFDGWKARRDLNKSKEFQMILDATENLSDDEINKMIDDPALRDSYGLSYSDVVSIANARFTASQERLASQATAAAAQEKIFADYQMKMVMSQNLEGITETLRAFREDGYVDINGMVIPASDKMVNTLISLQTSYSEDIKKGVSEDETWLNLQNQVSNYKLTTQQGAESDAAVGAVNNKDTVLNANAVIGDLNRASSILNIPAAEMELQKELYLIINTPNFALAELSKGDQALLKSRIDRVGKVVDEGLKIYDNNYNPFVKQGASEYVKEGDMTLSTADNILSNSNFNTESLNEGPVGFAFTKAEEVANEFFKGDENRVKPSSAGDSKNKPEQGSYGSSLTKKQRTKVMETFGEQIVEGTIGEALYQAADKLKASIPDSELYNKLELNAKIDNYLSLIYNNNSFNRNNGLALMMGIDLLVYETTGDFPKNGNKYEEFSVTVGKALADNVLTNTNKYFVNPEQIAFVKSMGHDYKPNSLRGPDTVDGVMEKLLQFSFTDHYANYKGGYNDSSIYSGSEYQKRFDPNAPLFSEGSLLAIATPDIKSEAEYLYNIKPEYKYYSGSQKGDAEYLYSTKPKYNYYSFSQKGVLDAEEDSS